MSVLNGIRERAIERFNNGERNKVLTSQNAKIMKSEKLGYLTTGIHLSPAKLVSKKTLCPHASKGCEAACLNQAGQAQLHFVRKTGRFTGLNIPQESRALRTIWYELDRPSFMAQLRKELKAFVKKAEREGLNPVARLNLTSDIAWHRTGIMQEFPMIQWMDYTANLYNDKLPENYHLTFSKKEDNDLRVQEAINRGMNVAIVFADMPDTYMGLPVIDGDNDDLRFLDNNGEQCIVGLKAKGPARKDNSGFVVQDNKKTYTLIDKLAA